MNGNHVI